MGKDSAISWTDHTFNAWVGCDKVSPACDHCYAEAWAKRTGHPELWQGQRRRTSEANWRQPLKRNREAARLGVRYRVFTNSLADVFDNKVPTEWRDDLWRLILATPNLDWLLLTKRIGNAPGMLPPDWGKGYSNVWLGATVIDQPELDRDGHKLTAIPARVHFLSIEPMLGLMTLVPTRAEPLGMARYVDWVIVGGESGGKARPMHPDWVRSLRDQCIEAGVPFHFKQWGEWAPGEIAGDYLDPEKAAYGKSWCGDEWINQVSMPDGHRDDEPDVYRVGKKHAGRLLDGRTWDEFPI